MLTTLSECFLNSVNSMTAREIVKKIVILRKSSNKIKLTQNLINVSPVLHVQIRIHTILVTFFTSTRPIHDTFHKNHLPSSEKQTDTPPLTN